MEVIAEFIDFSDLEILSKKKHKEKILAIGQVQSGKTRFMIDKSFEALKSSFDLAIILGGTNRNLLYQTQVRFNDMNVSNEFTLIDTSEKNYEGIPKNKTIVVCLKGKDSLEKLLRSLNNTVNSNEKSVIIFDDESDFGSINISSGKKPSTINKLIGEIYDYFETVTFVSVTATPFADVLSNSVNNFNRAHVIKPNSEYTGSDFFLKNNDIYTLREDLDDLKILKSMIVEHIKRVYKFGKVESQMLINNSLDTFDHVKMWQKVKGILDSIYTFYEMFKLNREHLSIVEEMNENLYIVNQEWNTINLKGKHSIVIGGALVSRGYTFENLITTVLSNEPQGKQSADTLLQRARWFGYRKNNELYKYMKVYLTSKTYNSLIECNELVENVFKKIELGESMSRLKDYLKNTKFEHIKPTNKEVRNEKENRNN